MKDLNKIWNEKAESLLLCKRIIQVRYLDHDEAWEMGWYERPIAFQVDDGTWFYPSRDDEGNGGGALFTSNETDFCLPVLR